MEKNHWEKHQKIMLYFSINLVVLIVLMNVMCRGLWTVDCGQWTVVFNA